MIRTSIDNLRIFAEKHDFPMELDPQKLREVLEAGILIELKYVNHYILYIHLIYACTVCSDKIN